MSATNWLPARFVGGSGDYDAEELAVIEVSAANSERVPSGVGVAINRAALAIETPVKRTVLQSIVG